MRKSYGFFIKVNKGNKSKFTLKHDGVRHAIELHETTNKPVKEICKITNISEATFYRRWREYQKLKNAVSTGE